MKTESINRILESYDENACEKCGFELIFLMLSYNADISEGKPYDHDLKHLIFKTNCIRNPIGVKYTSEDYGKTKKILTYVLQLANAINNPEIDTKEILRQDITIDNRIIKDILDVAVYTDCFYNMNAINSKRMDESVISQIPFVEQLISILLFYQDQSRLVREGYKDLIDRECITGMELSVANQNVEYYDNLKCSVTDSFETTLESMNEIAHYLYYQFGKTLKDKVTDAEIKFELIHPYENAEFERYLYIALQRHLLCRLEEGIRYGYYELGHLDETEEGVKRYLFSLESDEKYKARSIGIFRREYQVRNHVMFDIRNQEDISVAHDKLSILADEFINVQAGENVLLDFSEFHPDKSIFLEAERISKIKERIVETLTKDYYLDCEVKGVKIKDLLCAYKYLYTLSEVLFFASQKLIDDQEQSSYAKEICLVDIPYLAMELSRIHDLENNYAQKLVDRFVFHEKHNRDDDIFAQPLLKISKSQIILCQGLLDQLNLDRFIERQFIRYDKDVSEVGHVFEKKFLGRLQRGYSEGLFDFKYKKIPNFAVNTNEVKFDAFDGRQIEFDVIAVLGDYLILTELKAVMTSYDLYDLEKRKENVKEAIEQLQRRAESVKYDWQKIKERVSISLPEEPFDQEHIILIACTDAYDYTPLKRGNVFITDDSSYLKYFTSPYVDLIKTEPGEATIKNVKCIWSKGYPDAKEFMDYLMNPVTIHSFVDCMEKQVVPVPVMDEKDCALFCENYRLVEDPIKASIVKEENDGFETVKRTTEKIYPNDPCPCGSGKKYKKCCKNKAK